LGQEERALPYFERAASLGNMEAVEHARFIKQKLHMEKTLGLPFQLTAAAFQSTDSFEDMQKVVNRFPIMTSPIFIRGLENAIELQVPLHERAAFTRRLTWLRQVAND
jgi:hypothetical protein